MTVKTDDTATTGNKPARARKLLAVASGKGGVGKTWFSISLCHALAQQGKKVLLFDGDLGLANVDVQLGMVSTHDLGEAVEGSLPMARVIQHYADGGFDVIAGRSGHGSLANLPVPRLQEIIEQLRDILKDYDAILIDLGAGVDRTVRYLAAAADNTFVVTTDEPTSITDAYALIKLSNMAGQADNLRLVVNMSGSLRDGETTYNTILKACNNFLKISPPLAGIVRQDKRVRDAIRAQTPYLARYPNTETAEDIEKIAAKVAAEILA